MKDPYIGPRPFDWGDENDRKRFFGRDHEASEIRFRVHANPFLLLYAQSGAGKTSLLNAKLAPDLNADGFTVLPPVELHGPPRDDAESNKDPYLYHILQRWRSLLKKSDSSLQNAPKFLQDRLTGDSTPNSLAKLLLDAEAGESDDSKIATRQPGGESDQSQLVVIFDQLDELFASGASAEQHERFFEQVAECIRWSALIRFVFALRSEWVAIFDKYAAQVPVVVRSRYYLEPMGPDEAKLAITKPVELFGWHFYGEADGEVTSEKNPAAADALVRKLREAPGEFNTTEGEFVEPLQLQIVCQDIWERVQSREATSKTITTDDIGDVGAPLAEYYTKAVKNAAKISGISERRIREWVARNLITDLQRRGTVSQGQETTGGILNQVPEELARTRLLRREPQRGGVWYELVHAGFIGAILNSNKKWRSELSGAELLEEELRGRADAGGPLLAETELKSASLLLEKGILHTDESDKRLRQLVQRSEEELRRQQEELKRQKELQELRLEKLEQEKIIQQADLKTAKSQRLVAWISVALILIGVVLVAVMLNSKKNERKRRSYAVDDRAQKLMQSAYYNFALQTTRSGVSQDPRIGMLAAIDAVASCRMTDAFVSPRYALPLLFANALQKNPSADPAGVATRLPAVISPDGKYMLMKAESGVTLIRIDGTSHHLKGEKLTAMGFNRDLTEFGIAQKNGPTIIRSLLTLKETYHSKPTKCGIGKLKKRGIRKLKQFPDSFNTAPANKPWEISYDRTINEELKKAIGGIIQQYPPDLETRATIGVPADVFTDRVQKAYAFLLNGETKKAKRKLRKALVKIDCVPAITLTPFERFKSAIRAALVKVHIISNQAEVDKILVNDLLYRAATTNDKNQRKEHVAQAVKLDPNLGSVEQKTQEIAKIAQAGELKVEGDNFARNGQIDEAKKKHLEAVRLNPDLQIDPENEWKKFRPPESAPNPHSS